MKPVGDGLLWKSAPLAFEYAFSRPVSVVVAGINNMDMLERDLKYAENYTGSLREGMTDEVLNAPEFGNYVCRQCGKCMPCPVGIDIPTIFKYEGYFDRQMGNGIITDAAEYALRDRLRFWFGNSKLAEEKYSGLKVKVDKCSECGVCMPKCPYDIDIVRKLKIADFKLAGKEIY
jgi:predicted aldo/keto reductase-like oxidoreductase